MQTDSAQPRVAAPTAQAEFAAWVRPHWSHLTRFAQRLVGDAAAEDVVQDALAAAWRSRGRFDPKRGEPRAWLLAIVANQARDHRRHQRTGLTPLIEARDAGSRVEPLDLTRALGRLTHKQRCAVALCYYLGLPVADCAAVLECSTGTVKSTLSDARARLRAILGEEYRS